MKNLTMKDYAKINTQERFNWAEAAISALILPGTLLGVLMLHLLIGGA